MTDFINGMIVIAIYLLPTLLAFWRGHKSRYAIALVNVCLGWTLIMWFVALVWSLANSGHNVTHVYVKDR